MAHLPACDIAVLAIFENLYKIISKPGKHGKRFFIACPALWISGIVAAAAVPANRPQSESLPRP
jgi:hypothetical protein